jgi:transposase
VRHGPGWCCGPPPLPPGEEAQVDYGYLGSWLDPRSGRRRRVWAFSLVLPYSRHLFIRPVISMDQRAWAESHVQAFEFFGGCPRRLLCLAALCGRGGPMPSSLGIDRTSSAT